MTEILSPDEVGRMLTFFSMKFPTPYYRLTVADDVIALIQSHERLREMLDEAISRIASQSEIMSRKAEKSN